MTVKKGNGRYTLLFLHLKSANLPVGLGIRDNQLASAWKLAKAIRKRKDPKDKGYLVLGDLNTMGMRYPFKKSISADMEIKKIAKDAKRKSVGMRLLSKTGPTFSNGPSSSIPRSDLDQVVATANLKFTKFGGQEVDVRGWPKLQNDKKKWSQWVRDFSDHGLVYFELVQ